MGSNLTFAGGGRLLLQNKLNSHDQNHQTGEHLQVNIQPLVTRDKVPVGSIVIILFGLHDLDHFVHFLVGPAKFVKSNGYNKLSKLKK